MHGHIDFICICSVRVKDGSQSKEFHVGMPGIVCLGDIDGMTYTLEDFIDSQDLLPGGRASSSAL